MANLGTGPAAPAHTRRGRTPVIVVTSMLAGAALALLVPLAVRAAGAQPAAPAGPSPASARAGMRTGQQWETQILAGEWMKRTLAGMVRLQADSPIRCRRDGTVVERTSDGRTRVIGDGMTTYVVNRLGPDKALVASVECQPFQGPPGMTLPATGLGATLQY